MFQPPCLAYGARFDWRDLPMSRRGDSLAQRNETEDPMRKRCAGRTVAALAVLALVSVGCGGSGSDRSNLEASTWVLTPLAHRGSEARGEITATFDRGKVSGSGGCNSYSGTYTTKGSSMTISGVASTSAACAAPVMAAEQAYLAALGRTASYKAGDRALVLQGSDGAALLTYEASGGDAYQGSWNVVSFHSGSAITSVDTGTRIHVVMAKNAMTGNGGCNDFNASVKVDGSKITIGPVSSSKKACSPEIDQQEQAFFAALAESVEWAATGTTLDLLRADGGYAVNMIKG